MQDVPAKELENRTDGPFGSPWWYGTKYISKNRSAQLLQDIRCMKKSTVKQFVTLRAILIGLFLIIINAHWQTGMSSTLDIEITDLAIFSNVIFILFLIIVFQV